jgi:hypothetical protein
MSQRNSTAQDLPRKRRDLENEINEKARNGSRTVVHVKGACN